jgi:hypothetical protein
MNLLEKKRYPSLKFRYRLREILERIHAQSRTGLSNRDSVGTGGNPRTEALAKHASDYWVSGANLWPGAISLLKKMATLRSPVRYSLNPYSFNCDRNES